MKFGMCVNDWFSSIRLEMFDVNCAICFLMYFRKLLLFHLPSSWIVVSSIPASFIAMAPPDLMECVPISWASKPSSFVSIEFTDFLRKLMLSLLEIW